MAQYGDGVGVEGNFGLLGMMVIDNVKSNRASLDRITVISAYHLVCNFTRNIPFGVEVDWVN